MVMVILMVVMVVVMVRGGGYDENAMTVMEMLSVKC